MEKKYPKFVVGAFVINKDGELFLWKKPGEYFTCPNFKVLWGESIEETLRNGLKSKMGVDVAGYSFINLVEGLHIKTGESEETNLIFADYRISLVDDDAFDPSGDYSDREYRWLKPEEWVELDDEEFGPYITEAVTRLVLK